MKIVSLTAENFKRLTAVHIEPNGNLVQITGKNGNGKSSVLDAIWAALCGKEAAPLKPIRDGEQHAIVKLDLGEIKVTRKFKLQAEGGFTTSLTVENAEGLQFKSPQTMLDALWNSLAIDPLEFALMDARKQFSVLQQFVPGVDFGAIAMAHASDYTKRTEATRKAREARAAAQVISLPEKLPAEPINEAALIQKLTDCSKHNTEIETRRANRVRGAEQAVQLRADAEIVNEQREAGHRTALAQIEEIKAEAARRIATIEQQAKELSERRHHEMEDKLAKALDLEQKLAAAPPLPEPMDPAEIQTQIAQAREMNQLFAMAKQRADLIAAADRAEHEAQDLTQRIDARTKARDDAIRAAKMPVEGLGFGDGFITLNDAHGKPVPFEQASDADKLRVSLAIAMAANPKLRVIRAKNGSLLDSDHLKIIEEMVREKDYQLWLERLDETGEVGFFIEDGHVRYADGNIPAAE